MMITMMMTTMLMMLVQMMMAMIMIMMAMILIILIMILIIIINDTENGRKEKDLRSGHILGGVLNHCCIYIYAKYRGIHSKVAFILLYFLGQGLTTCPWRMRHWGHQVYNWAYSTWHIDLQFSAEIHAIIIFYKALVFPTVSLIKGLSHKCARGQKAISPSVFNIGSIQLPFIV